MNELEKSNEKPGFFESIARDEGFQRSLASVGVAAVVAAVRYAVFGTSD